MSYRSKPAARAALLSLAFVAFGGAAAASAAIAPDPHKPAALSVPFVENAGQLDPAVFAQARLPGGAATVLNDGALVYTLNGASFVERFAAGPPAPRMSNPLPTRVASFIGDQPSRHRSDLRTFERVALGEVFDGIDVELRAVRHNVEKIFTVRPGADPARIRLAFDGGSSVGIDADGALRARTPDGEIAFTAPIAYQEANGRRDAVEVAYAPDTSGGGYGFRLGPYDASRPLVIDPFVQSTYFGGSGQEFVTGLAVHPTTGDVILAGYTMSTDLPCTVAAGACGNAARPIYAGGTHDGFVARFSPDLTVLKQVTYFGGTALDFITAMAINPANGEVIVAGYTFSTDLPCVTPAGVCATGAMSLPPPERNGFAARFSADLTQLRQATYWGGSNADYVFAMAVHPVSGEIILAGQTLSTNMPCVSIATGCGEGAQSTHFPLPANLDGFIVRLSATLTQQLQATYLGGTLDDGIKSIAIDPGTGDIVVAGFTVSASLPCAAAGAGCVDGAQPVHASDAGEQDGFVSRLSADLTQFRQTSFIGGNAMDHAYAVAIHPATGDIYVAGDTRSTDLPCAAASIACAAGAQSTVGPASTDGFVTRFAPDLRQVRQSTYFGGTGVEHIAAIAVHPGNGEVIVTGRTTSTGAPAGSASSLQPNRTGALDAFVARLAPDLTRIRQSTYLGGLGGEFGDALVVDAASGHLLVAGVTSSADFPCTNAGTGCANGARPSLSVADDAYVTRITDDLTLLDTRPNPFAFAAKLSVPPASLQESASAQISGLSAPAPVYVSGPPGSAFCVSASATCGTCTATGGWKTSATVNIASVTNGEHVCVRHLAPPVAGRINASTLQVGSVAAEFVVATGNFGPGTNCTLDVDGNNLIDALTDGLMLIRAMFGLTGTAVTNNAIGGGSPTRTTWSQIQTYLNGNCGSSFAP